jgi:hypothetical protein
VRVGGVDVGKLVAVDLGVECDGSNLVDHLSETRAKAK